jgi:hypothetical protein
MSVLCPVLVLHSPEYQNATELRFSQQNTNEVDDTHKVVFTTEQ